MNPLAVKIWIAGCCALHTSTAGEPTTIVPKRVFPDPEKRRSRRTGDAAAWVVELGASGFVDRVRVGTTWAVEVVRCAPAALPAAAVSVEPLP